MTQEIQLLKALQVATLRSAIRQLDGHDDCDHSAVNHPGLVEASRVLYAMIHDIAAAGEE